MNKNTNRYENLTFNYYFKTLLTNFSSCNFNLDHKKFHEKLLIDVRQNFIKFINIFVKFDLIYSSYNSKFKKLR